MQRISEVAYEDDSKDLPSVPDVANYLVSEVSLILDIVSMFSLPKMEFRIAFFSKKYIFLFQQKVYRNPYTPSFIA